MKQEKIREILRKYTLDDCLRPQYDGMTAWELAGIILKVAEEPDEIKIVVSTVSEEPADDKFANLKPKDDIFAK